MIERLKDWKTRSPYSFNLQSSILPSSLPALPVRPQAVGLHLVRDAALFEDLRNFRAGLARARTARRVGDARDRHGGDGRIQAGFAEVHLVDGVGLRVVVGQVPLRLLVRDQVGNAFEEEIEVVGSEERLVGKTGGSPRGDRLQQR